MEGKVVVGTGKGMYFVGLEGYRKQFNLLLGIDPYPGTLNLEVVGRDFFLAGREMIYIPGFKRFGGIKCYRVLVENIPCFAIIPDKSKYENVLEIVSSEFLREKLDLKDGDTVIIE